MNGEKWQPAVRFPPDDSRKLDSAIPPVSEPRSGTEPEPGADPLFSLAGEQAPGKQRGTRDRIRRVAIRLVVGSLLVLLLSLGGLEIHQFLQRHFETRPALGWFFSGLLGVLALALVVLAAKEATALFRLRNLGKLREEGEQLIAAGAYGHAGGYCATIAKLYEKRESVGAGLERFRAQVKSFHNDGEMLSLFSREVLAPLDVQSYRMIERHARQAALFSALSPFAVLDAILLLWRNVRLIRVIAETYGGRSGTAANFVLTREVIRSLVIAGATDLLADAAGQALGASLLSIVSANAAHGLVSGLFTARIGLRAMRLCRPVPFAEDQTPTIRRMSREIVRAVVSQSRNLLADFSDWRA